MPGAVVECGVWKGGSMMAAALTLLRLGDTERDLYLYDTFEGMRRPTDEDVPADDGYTPTKPLGATTRERGRSVWATVSLDDVARPCLDRLPAERVHCVEGKVEDTIPAQAPEQIALLRLDTDWYESTRHELEHCTRGSSPAAC